MATQTTKHIAVRATPEFKQKFIDVVKRCQGENQGARAEVLNRFLRLYVRFGNKVWNALHELEMEYDSEELPGSEIEEVPRKDRVKVIGKATLDELIGNLMSLKGEVGGDVFVTVDDVRGRPVVDDVRIEDDTVVILTG
jgi:hypothetical protein